MLHILCEVTCKLPDVAHLVLVTRCVIECYIKIEQQLLASESVPFSFHFVSAFVVLSLLGRVLHRPDRQTVVSGVVVHVSVRRIEVQVVSIRSIIERSGPVVAIRAESIQRSTIVVACSWQR